MQKLFILLLFVCFLPGMVMPSFAVVSCHCFQNRSFDPARPDAADAYFLATIQNSLVAAAFNLPKRNIVQAKMGGIDADLLWVAYYVADRTGLNAEQIFESWVKGSGWSDLLSRLSGSVAKLDPPFVLAMSSPSDIKVLARGAFRSVMISQVGIEKEVLDGIEISGANRKEQSMAIFLSLLTGGEPVDFYKSVSKGQQTWGQLLASTGLDPDQIEPSWEKLLKLHRSGL